LMGGCTSDSASNASPEPWNEPDAVWMQPAGTPLARGVTVPEGARLVGPIFSQFDESKALDGEFVVGYQQGYVVVDGEPYAVATNLLGQWDGPNGLGQYPKDTVCRQQVDDGMRSRFYNYDYKGEAADGAVEISCMVSLKTAGERWSRAIGMSFTQDLTDPNAPVQGAVGWQPPPVAIPDALPDAPQGVDGPSSVASDVDYLPDLKIVEGSFLAGPPTTGYGTGGYIAVIGVMGDPDEVFDAYVEQDNTKPYLVADEVVQGMRIREYKSAEAGGIWLDITLNELDGNAWILLNASND